MVGVYSSNSQSFGKYSRYESDCTFRQEIFASALKAVLLPEDKDPCRGTGGMPSKERCYISTSLFCRDNICQDRYVTGLLEMLRSSKALFPGWKVRVYTDGSLDAKVKEMMGSYGAEEEVVDKAPGGQYGGTFWRFFAVNDKNIDRVIIRDADSVFMPREQAAVHEWIKSTFKWHIMHDHPYHTLPMLAGMWAVRRLQSELRAVPLSLVKDLYYKNSAVQRLTDSRQGDQTFLDRYLWPEAKKGVLVHDSFTCGSYPTLAKKPFPVPRRAPWEFVGNPNMESKNYEYFSETTWCPEGGAQEFQSKMLKRFLGRTVPAKCRANFEWLFG